VLVLLILASLVDGLLALLLIVVSGFILPIIPLTKGYQSVE